MKMPDKVLVADDHPLVRDALVRTIAGAFEVGQVLQADTFAGVLAALGAGDVGLALVDLHMPGMDALAGIRRLRAAHPALTLIVASGDDAPTTIRAALALGARGFLPKVEPPEVLVQALRLVLSGGTYIPSGAMADLGREGAAAPPPPPGAVGLTPRQADVLQCLARGLPNKLIARELNLTEGTVKTHLAAILRELQARNRTEAVVRAREAGWLS